MKHDTARFSVPTNERIIQESGSKIEEVPTLGIVPQFTPKTYQPQAAGIIWKLVPGLVSTQVVRIGTHHFISPYSEYNHLYESVSTSSRYRPNVNIQGVPVFSTKFQNRF